MSYCLSTAVVGPVGSRSDTRIDSLGRTSVVTDKSTGAVFDLG